MTTTITIDPPLPCCAAVSARVRCGKPATVAQATMQADGSFYLQPFCKGCVAGMVKNYFPEKASEE